jgi:hypothetical protein
LPVYNLVKFSFPASGASRRGGMALRFTKGVQEQLSSLITAEEEIAFFFARVKFRSKRLNPIRQQAMI